MVLLRQEGRCFWMRQRLDQRTFRWTAGFALPDESAERDIDCPQVGDFAPYVLTMADSGQPNIVAGTLTLFSEAEQAAYLVERKAELSCPADEGKTRDSGGVINPTATLGAPWPAQHADLLIEADRVDTAAYLLRHLANRLQWAIRFGG